MKTNLLLTLAAAALVIFIFMDSNKTPGPIKLLDINSGDIRSISFSIKSKANEEQLKSLPLKKEPLASMNSYVLLPDDQGVFSLSLDQGKRTYSCDRKKVDQLLSTAADIEILRIIKQDVSLENPEKIKKQYGIDPENKSGQALLKIDYRIKKLDKKLGKEIFQDRTESLVFGRPGIKEGRLYALDSAGRILMIASSQMEVFRCSVNELRDKRLLPVNPFNIDNLEIKYADSSSLKGMAFKKTDSYRWQITHPRTWEAQWQKIYQLFSELQEPAGAAFIEKPESPEEKLLFIIKSSSEAKPRKIVFYSHKDYKGLIVKSSVTNSWLAMDKDFFEKLTRDYTFYLQYSAATFQTHLGRRIVIADTLVEQNPIDWRWYFSKHLPNASDSASAADRLFKEPRMYDLDLPDDLKKEFISQGSEKRAQRPSPDIKYRVAAGLVEALSGSMNSMRISGLSESSRKGPLDNPDLELRLVTLSDMKEKVHLFQVKNHPEKKEDFIWYNSDYNECALIKKSDFSKFSQLAESLKKDIARFK